MESPHIELSLDNIEEGDDESVEENNNSGDEEAITDKQDYTTLPYLLSSLFGTILEDTITQLRILVECNNELRIIKTKSDWNYLQCIKYGVKQPPILDELYGIDQKNLGTNEHKINKLDTDRKFITDVTIDTYVDLCLNRTFGALENSVNTIVTRDSYQLTLVEEEAKNRALRRDLNRQLRQQRNHIKTVVYETEAKIDNLRTQVEDSALIAECRSRYIENWQRARTEQHIQVIQDTEFVYSDAVDYLKQRTDHEQRVHMEIELLINIAINETLQKVEQMMDKYDKDMEAIDLKIQIKKNDYQNMLEKRVNLERTIEKHEKLMKDWVYFKEEREKARLYHEKMTSSALVVQAWWRGLLVRRQMGPYRPKKKPPAKKK